MEFITIQEVEKIAKPGDKLQGILYQYPDGLPQNKVRVNEITFWDCICCLTGKPDVIDGADYYLQKQANGTFKKYGITRIINECMKVPKEFIEHLANKYIQIEEESIIEKWENWELVNCYYEEEPKKLISKRYCCCNNVTGNVYIEEFYTNIAVWGYLYTDMTAEAAHTLDKRISNKEIYIKILKAELKDLKEYKKKFKKLENKMNHLEDKAKEQTDE